MRILTIFVLALVAGGGCKKISSSSAAVQTGGPASTERSGGGGGAVSAVRGAVQRKAVNANDMKQIHLFIDTASGASGRMPKTSDITAALQKEAPALAALIADGTIVLTGASQRSDIWAYEAKALESRGWTCSSGGVEMMDKDALKNRLGQ